MNEFLQDGISQNDQPDAIYIAESDKDVRPDPNTVEGYAIQLFHNNKLTGRYGGKETLMSHDPCALLDAIEQIAEAGQVEIAQGGLLADRWSALSCEGIMFLGKLREFNGSYDA